MKIPWEYCEAGTHDWSFSVGYLSFGMAPVRDKIHVYGSGGLGGRYNPTVVDTQEEADRLVGAVIQREFKALKAFVEASGETG